MVLVPQGHDLGKRLCCEIAGVVVELRPQDLSLAGLFVPGTMSLPLDREVDLRLRSPIGELAVTAQVVQVISPERALAEGRCAGAGLLFINLGDDQRAFIGLTLDALLRVARVGEPPAKKEQQPGRKQEHKREPHSPNGAHSEDQPQPKPEAAPIVLPKSNAPTLQGHKSPVPRKPEPVPAVRPQPMRAEPRPKPATPECQQALRELEQELAAIQTKAPWAMLGLTEGADLGAAKQAFLTLSKRCHPHAFAHFDSPQISKAATALFIARKKALEALQALLRPPPLPTIGPISSRTPTLPGGGAAKTSRPPQTSPHTPRGRATSIKPVPARQSMKPVSARAPRGLVTHASSPTKGASQPPVGARRAADAELALASGLKHLAASRFDAAAVELERARSLHPGSRDPELWLRVCRAREAKTRGRRDEIRQLYQEVLELDPEHREALEHVSGRDRRKRTGLISKLFGADDE